jgi:hypothetical protein
MSNLETNVPAIATGTENILIAAQEDAGFDKILKFKKGEYFIGEEKVLLHTQYVAHPEAWTKSWIKFEGSKVVDRRLYFVARGEKPPEREDLDDADRSTWSVGLDGKPHDPWQQQYLLPLEDPTSGEVVVFTTGSFGGKRAVGELCSAWAKREKRGGHGQPLVQLHRGEMQTKKFGKVPTPEFRIVGWSDTAGDASLEPPPATSEKDFEEQIPF